MALHWLGIAEIRAAYARRQTSPVELVQALLKRIEAANGRLHAFLPVDPEDVLGQAQEAERALKKGATAHPLTGIPIAVKDLIDVAGKATTCHSRILLKNIASQDAEVVRRLRAAGALILGKTALHEFAIGGPSFDLPYPPARNPWDLSHHPGGSSSGSGAAVAAGLTPVALGTDTAGSIRHPAGVCGIAGLKPTYGAVSRRGVFPLAFSLDHVGPMARTVADLALVLETIAGHDTLDAGSSARPTPHYTLHLGTGVRGIRLGFVRHFHEKDLVADPQVAASLEDVIRTLRSEGATVHEINLTPLREFAETSRIIMSAEAWAIHAKWLRERPGDYAQMSRQRLMTGAFLSAGDYVYSQQRRSRLIGEVDSAFRNVDVLVTASSMDLPCRIDDIPELERRFSRQARAPFSLTGHPALAMMCGLSRERLPLAVQFIGRPHDEATVLQVAAAYERATQWHNLHPEIDA